MIIIIMVPRKNLVGQRQYYFMMMILSILLLHSILILSNTSTTTTTTKVLQICHAYSTTSHQQQRQQQYQINIIPITPSHKNNVNKNNNNNIRQHYRYHGIQHCRKRNRIQQQHHSTATVTSRSTMLYDSSTMNYNDDSNTPISSSSSASSTFDMSSLSAMKQYQTSTSVLQQSISPTSTSTTSSTTTTGSTNTIIIPNTIPTIWSSRYELYKMIRPNNIPGIILFHMLGIYLVYQHMVRKYVSISSISSNLPNYWTIVLTEPTLWITLLVTNLVSGTSMIVNDYYDAKLGRDTLKQHFIIDPTTTTTTNTSTTNNTTITNVKWILHPTNGLWNKIVTRQLLMYLYSIALLLSNCLPGIPTRISITIALMMTYLYTVHLKPMTFIKNIICASLIALAPFTSGSCTMYLLEQKFNIYRSVSSSATSSSSSSSILSFLSNGVWVIPSLWRLFGILFTGVLGREICMDCTDIDPDRASGIRTIPVVYGTMIASIIATISSLIMAYLAIISPLHHFLQKLNVMDDIKPLVILTLPSFRRLALASIGCIIQMNSMRKIIASRGKDRTIINKMIDQNLYTVVLLMASFI